MHAPSNDCGCAIAALRKRGKVTIQKPHKGFELLELPEPICNVVDNAREVVFLLVIQTG